MSSLKRADKLQQIWQPMDIGPTKVKNRVMMTAMGVFYGKDNILSDRHIDYYAERAKGGLALIITEQQAGHRLSKGSFYDGCTAWEKRAVPQYAKLADAVHEHGIRMLGLVQEVVGMRREDGFMCDVVYKGGQAQVDWLTGAT